MLLTEINQGRSTLRIDTVSVSQPLGSAVNIARIDTVADAVHIREAKFTEIAVKDNSHLFATFAYQSSPIKVNYLTLSEAT